MKIILVYAGEGNQMIHETAFNTKEDALDYIIESPWTAEALIEYDGVNQASVFSGQHLDTEISSRITDLAESKAEQARLESENPR